MSLKVSRNEINALLKLDADKRYWYAIKRIVDQEEAWGLYKNGWALAEDDSKKRVFSLWPAKKYAELCAQNQWEGYESEAIELSDLIEELLPMLKKDGFHLSIFNLPTEKGIIIEVDRFLNDLKNELIYYE